MTTAKRLRWWSIGNLLFTLLLAAYLLYLWRINIPEQHYFGVHQGGGFNVNVNYTPGKPDAIISVRLDGLSRHQTVEYEVVSSESWAPSWRAQVTGKSSEFLTLHDGWSSSPGPMTQALAEKVARSYKVTLKLDGQERVIDFKDGGQVFSRSNLLLYEPLRAGENP